jgi:hypothetical protein
MRGLAWLLGASVCLLAACGAAHLGGGSPQDGGSGAGGAAGGGGSAAGGSPGAVTFVLSVAPGTPFCDQLSCGSSSGHLVISDESGQVVPPAGSPCTGVACDSCLPIACPLLAVLCPAPEGVPYVGSTSTWDGAYTGSSTCGASQTSCFETRYAPPGRYLARFCATPGTVTQPDAGLPVCTASGPTACTETWFDFPAAAQVQLTLPAAEPAL